MSESMFSEEQERARQEQEDELLNYTFRQVKQYFRDHDEISWGLTEAAIKKLYPQYSSSFNEMGEGLTCSWYNMLIASWSFWDGYLSFLFDILFEVKKDLIITDNPLQIRIFGNLSERLLNTYLRYHKKYEQLQVHYLPVTRIS